MMDKLKRLLKSTLPVKWYSGLSRLYHYTFAYSVPFLVVIVGQACNYRCRDCGNFCPISPAKYKHYDLSEILKSIDIILKNTPYVEELQIQGGEPFLYPEIGGVLTELGLRRDKIRHITIATNGSIVPDDSVFEIMHKNNVLLRISDYGRSRDKLKELVKKCRDYEVEYMMYEFAAHNSTWFALGGKNFDRTEDEEVVEHRFDTCLFNGCLTLERNELSHCSRASNSYHIQGFSRKRGDYLRVEDAKEFYKKLKQYIISPKKMEACHYCNGTTNEHTIAPAIQEGESA